MDPKTALGMLAEANNPASRFESKMRALGGTPTFDSDLRLWRVPFEDGSRKLDLWATRPLLGAGEHVARTTRMEAGEAETDFEAGGLTAYLEGKGPGAAALLDYARTACTQYRERLLFEADAHGVTAWRTATAGMNLMVGSAADAHEGRRTGAPAQRNRGEG